MSTFYFMKIQIPQGLEVPESGTVDLVTTFEVSNGELMPVAIDGISLPEEAETEEPEEAPEEQMGSEEEQMAPEEAGPQKPGGSPDSFMAAIEAAMSKSKGQKMK